MGGRRIRRGAVLVCSLVMVMAAAAPSMAITYGEPTEEHPYVGGVMIVGAIEFGVLSEFLDLGGLGGLVDDDEIVYPTIVGFSGVLVDEDVVLTVAHGTGADLEALLGPALFEAFDDFHALVTFEADASGPLAALFFQGPDAPGWHEGRALAHEDFDDFAQFPATFDIGAVVLDEPVLDDLGLSLAELPGIAPLGYLDELAAQRGRNDQSLTVVGYGAHDTQVAGALFAPDGQPILDVRLEFDDHRHVGEVRLVNLSSALTDGHSLQHSGNPGRWSGGTCFGDSGGPVLHGDTLVGLTSFRTGSPMCRGNISFAYRVDTEPAHDFMAEIGLVNG